MHNDDDAADRSTIDPGLTPLRRSKRLSDQVADVLLDRIRLADLRPGDRLPSERELAERLQVARTVVREAVRELAARGIVTVRAGSGVVVAEPDGVAATASLSEYLRGSRDMSFESIHEVRHALESEIAELAARRATDGDVVRLRAAFDRQLATKDDFDEAVLADYEFHRILAQITQNSLFLVILDALREAMLEVRRQAMRLPGNLEIGLEAHRRIVDAIAARDPKGARREMSRHFEVSYREFFSGGLPRVGRDPGGAEPTVDVHDHPRRMTVRLAGDDPSDE